MDSHEVGRGRGGEAQGYWPPSLCHIPDPHSAPDSSSPNTPPLPQTRKEPLTWPVYGLMDVPRTPGH